MNPFASLADQIRGAVQLDAPLAACTTYRIGGPAMAVVEPAGKDDVMLALERAREAGVPWLAMGLGSNLLVRDGGFPGLVIRLGRGMAGVTQHSAGRWRVGAGLATPLLARRTARAGFAGVHRLVGVPGTVGGGVYMNAGAHGQEFKDTVRRLWLVDAEGRTIERAGRDVDWVYRSSQLGPMVVLQAELALHEEDPAVLDREMREHFRWRKEGTPFQEPCCGSVFRNPTREDGKTAGRLVDEAGLKGFRVGGAEVSRMHGNYIVNTGGATASDVLAVIAHVRDVLAQRTGSDLELEVQVVGHD